MILRIRIEDAEWFRAHPQVWWANEARWALGRVALSPVVEVDENNEPTGWLIDADWRYDAWDQLILDVCLAGKAYVLSLGDEEQAAALVAYQAQKDKNALDALMANAELSFEEKVLAVKQEVIRQAGVLGVDLPEMDENLNIITPFEEFVEPVIEEEAPAEPEEEPEP